MKLKKGKQAGGEKVDKKHTLKQESEYKAESENDADYDD